LYTGIVSVLAVPNEIMEIFTRISQSLILY
jgi:hypothetical protein